MPEPLNSGDISTRLQKIATLAREHPERAFRSIHHVIDIDWLREAYRRTRKDGAVGVDGQSGAQYARDLEKNLQSLLGRLKSGSYQAPPVRRVHIPKGDGRKTRPIGLPTFEDKLLQRAVAMALSAIYEETFLDCSYGFRPGRSAHDALQATRDELMSNRGGWVLEVDVRSFFDELKLIRYADDFVIIFELEQDAKRVEQVLPKRFGKYGLRLHPDKTRLMRFERPGLGGGGGGGRDARPATFDLLGFTHYWAKSRRGYWVVQRRTASGRLTRSLRKLWQWCKAHRHRSVGWQRAMLASMLQGHYGYFGLTGNGAALETFRNGVLRAWRNWLGRRGGKRAMSWERFTALLAYHPLPNVRVVHSVYRRSAKA